MKTMLVAFSTAALILGCLLPRFIYRAAAVRKGSSPSPLFWQPNEVKAAVAVTLNGTVVSLDSWTAVKELKGSAKRVRLGEESNLQRVRSGDHVVARYQQIVTIRKMRPGEAIPPTSVIETIPLGQLTRPFGGGFTRQVTWVGSIAARNGQQIAFRTLHGLNETLDVANPADSEKFALGEPIVVTLSQTLVLSLDDEARR
jgi:hypothetical protein